MTRPSKRLSSKTDPKKQRHPKANETTFKKGHTKHPQANKGKGYSKETKKFIGDLFKIYRKVGGRKFLLNHIKNNVALSEKFLERLTKIAMKEIERDIKISMEVSGDVSHTHLHKYGFTPEAVAMLMESFKSGAIDVESFRLDPIPELPEGEILPVMTKKEENENP